MENIPSQPLGLRRKHTILTFEQLDMNLTAQSPSRLPPAKRLARTSNLRRRKTSVPNLRAPNGCSASQARKNKRANYFGARPATPLPRSFKARMTRRDG